ncbi:response regulator [Spirochaeta cellobiosiphila]|uniref:response regulator n=1 Tax=Spirochaeta cellobiosiphila TaxID=504483 RepID=UPI0004910842|nr:response regulator [Spirochaeta cellobiosiphila]
MGTSKLEHHKSILIVDDLPFVRKKIKEVLRMVGYHIAGEASDGLEGLNMIRQLKPDLVLLDITMPKMDGLQVLKQLDKSQKVIMCSSLGEEKYILTAIKWGAMDFIVKPFTDERLIRAVHNVLSR